eukprot:1000257_1
MVQVSDWLRWTGREDITNEQIESAAKSANAHKFIMKLEDGYDTDVGQSGHKMSGGQKQRIAIARAIVRDPRILLLDEATSALDSESERVVQAALDKVMTGRTTIIVAHRLSTIRQADKIILIQEGKVTEEGSHDDLMAKGGAYMNLVQSQAKNDQEANSCLKNEQAESLLEEKGEETQIVSKHRSSQPEKLDDTSSKDVVVDVKPKSDDVLTDDSKKDQEKK